MSKGARNRARRRGQQRPWPGLDGRNPLTLPADRFEELVGPGFEHIMTAGTAAGRLSLAACWALGVLAVNELDDDADAAWADQVETVPDPDAEVVLEAGEQMGREQRLHAAVQRPDLEPGGVLGRGGLVVHVPFLIATEGPRRAPRLLLRILAVVANHCSSRCQPLQFSLPRPVLHYCHPHQLQPLVAPQLSQTWQLPARFILTPHDRHSGASVSTGTLLPSKVGSSLAVATACGDGAVGTDDVVSP